MQLLDNKGISFFFGHATEDNVKEASVVLGRNFGHTTSDAVDRFRDHLQSHITPFNDKGVIAAVSVASSYQFRNVQGILCYKLVPYQGLIKCYVNSLAVDEFYDGELNIAHWLIRKLVSYLHAEFGIDQICNVTIVVEDEGQAPVGFYRAAGFKKTSAIYEADALELNWRALLGRDGGHWEELTGELNSLRELNLPNGGAT